MSSRLDIEDLLDSKRETLQLDLLTSDTPLDRIIGDADISSPGLALAGYTQRFPGGRMQVLGETEITYMETLSPAILRDRLTEFFKVDMPAVFVTKGQQVPGVLIELAAAAGVPVMRSSLSTRDFFLRIKPYLEEALAPSTTIHGSLADVYGVGLLFVGQSGIGKSECVLDLVERGHRFVADDLVFIAKRGSDILLGRGHELQRHHMEIRGIGIVDVRAMFGTRATRMQKRVEVVVQLEVWDDTREYDRTGLEQDEMDILGVQLPKVTIPLNPGKNLTVISEVVAMNHLLKFAGVDSAALFHERLKGAMRPVRDYLQEDYE